MRKITALLLCFAALICLSSCGGKAAETSAGSETVASAGSEANQKTDVKTESTPDPSGNKTVKKEFVMPTYYEAEYNETKQTALQYISNNGFSYIFMTDMHIDYDNVSGEIERQCKTAVKLANETGVDCIILGGDIIHGCNTQEAELGYLNSYVNIFKEANCPTFIARGNHDENPYHSKGEKNKTVPPEYIIPADMWCRVLVDDPDFSRNMPVHDTADPTSTYYYVDFKDKKTRVVFLDPYDHPFAFDDKYMLYVSETWNKLSDRQMQWFATEALDPTLDGWNYMVMCHAPVLKLNEGTFGNATTVREILAAFNDKAAYVNNTYNIDVDFSLNKSCATVCHFGHTHVDGHGIDNATDMLYLNTGNAKTKPFYPNNGGTDRTAGTVTEALFDLVTYNSGKVNRIRFGAGRDESFDLSVIK